MVSGDYFSKFVFIPKKAYKRKKIISAKMVSLMCANYNWLKLIQFFIVKQNVRQGLNAFGSLLTSTIYHCYAFSARSQIAYIKLQQNRASLLYTKKYVR